MGGGMSQNYAALYFFEHYIKGNGIEYVLEIGTQKGALSLYLANMANATEQFIFHTIDISTGDYYDRAGEGIGHWLDKLNEIGDYSEFYNGNVFENIGLFNDFVKKYKSLIFCDGGDKANEFRVFSEIAKPGDLIVLHDWGKEVTEQMILPHMNKFNVNYHQPYADSCSAMQTLLMPFIKS